MNLKNKRLEKSKVNNPLCSDYKPQAKKETVERNNIDSPGKNKRNRLNKKNQRKEFLSNTSNEGEKTFIGVSAKPGSTALRSKYKLKVQAQLHHKELNKEKKQKKKLTKMEPIKAVVKGSQNEVSVLEKFCIFNNKYFYFL